MIYGRRFVNMVLQGLCLFAIIYSVSCVTQEEIDYIANNLQVTYEVLDHFKDGSFSFEGQFRVTNTGSLDITSKEWELYWNNLRMMEPRLILDGPNNIPKPEGVPIGDESLGLRVYHENGFLFKILPTESFQGFQSGVTVIIPWTCMFWHVARSDIFPRWYVTGKGLEARTLVSTASESIDFVPEFEREEKWKRYPQDRYNPFTPQIRYEINDGRAKKVDLPNGLVVPTPKSAELSEEEAVNVATRDWVIVAEEDLKFEADYLAGQLETIVVHPDDAPSSRIIHLQLSDIPSNSEWYNLTISNNPEKISIVSGMGDAAGIYYGCQTFVSLFKSGSGFIPVGFIVDYPRFPYRGMHLDVSRNFQSKDTVLQLLDGMSQYKLNKFHFHLTDDEGWRLEILTIPELTEIGARRCHTDVPDTCLRPQYGSGPGIGNSGTGYYTVEEYKEILKYANDRHIEVIPEFDMPGHGHSAIKAMEARYNKYKDTDIEKAEEFLLTDLNDTSEYISVQMYKDNAIDPCRDSTYRFIEEVVTQVKLLHSGIQDLKIFHFGGDEVPATAWTNSSQCQTSPSGGGFENDEELKAFWKEYNVKEISRITNEQGLDMGAWEDGLMTGSYDTFNRSEFVNDEVYANAWDNIWEQGHGSRAYILANNGYRVVLSHATYIYFDHPQEPDPEERGFYWSTRYIDVFKTFSYLPERVYDNIDVNRAGDPLEKDEVCQEHGCEPLNKPQNIRGIQGQLWAETVRQRETLHDMIFPRILALAERAWHKAAWEDIDDKVERERQRNIDWERFSNLLAKQELGKLDDRQITYNIPPPGVSVSESKLATANTAFPGLTIQYSFDDGNSWADYKDPVQLPEDSDTLFVVRSANMARHSRMVTITDSQK